MSDTLQPGRFAAGNCPTCGRVVLVLNNGESWPLIACKCGWRGGIGDQANPLLVAVQPAP